LVVTVLEGGLRVAGDHPQHGVGVVVVPDGVVVRYARLAGRLGAGDPELHLLAGGVLHGDDVPGGGLRQVPEDVRVAAVVDVPDEDAGARETGLGPARFGVPSCGAEGGCQHVLGVQLGGL